MKSSEFVINQINGLKWLSFHPLCTQHFVLHGFLPKNQNRFLHTKPKMLEEVLCRITSLNRRSIALSQTHQDQCVVLTRDDQLKNKYRGDAILTNREDVFISVQVADCLPVFLVNDTNKVIGLIHAGWRGTILGITRKVLNMARVDLDCKAEDFTALLGPCIRSCCYHISDDLAILFDEDCILRTTNGHAKLDLMRANVKQLTDCGVKQNRIFAVDQCTCCNGDLFSSHRREGIDAGRMIGFIALK